ncbi:SDR family oxidoreductase [Vibrio cortegadensis]|uniref:SDR family NAD(P)-dependent oxidoreductase n=1 Tax=Vibrio cortegadensis TaxID=1328770 RepID=UPI0021C39429|nr:SDR family oxidoreductase [Vibrio cortegadensis]MDN3697498.1 SDR family oxidoreductase [Vibrio cortegadensis]
MKLNGKKALITGALGSLGRAETEAMLEQGADLYILDLDSERGNEYIESIKGTLADGQHIEFIECDLSNLDNSYNVVKDLCEKVGGIDILVNNAAIMPHGAIEDISLDTFELAQRINTSAAYALIKAVVPFMKEKKEGRIVNFCSITMNGGWGDYSPYIASKGATLALTRTMARELGAWNILVNAVAPGAIPSEAEQKVFGDKWEEYNEWVLEHQSLKHRGDPKDIGDMVVFLSSEESRFMTGQNLHVNGGWLMEG